ncbi:MAG: helix-turn-helix domain-containing protein [Poseidonibacter sp.]
MSYNKSLDKCEYTKKIEKEFINIKIPFSDKNMQLVDHLFDEVFNKNLKKLAKNWLVDEKNCSIISPYETYFLTKKELVFIKLLLKNKIVTYEEMMWHVWEGKFDITQNAIKVFVKNFKKKIPPSILKNLNGIGYRFVNTAS